MKVLITGAGGNLGRVLSPALEKIGPMSFSFYDVNRNQLRMNSMLF